jgi:hypothetical protein
MAIQHNVRETDQLDQDELVEVTAAANAWVSIKRTFEMWATIGRGVQRLRTKADALGGRRTFQRLMDQNGLGELCSPKLKAVVTRLLKIMDNLGPVGTWHNSLSPHQRVAWASPTSVYRHCPVFTEAKAGKPKGERPARRVHFEIAIDSIVESLLNKPVPERWKVIDRLTKALGLDGEAKPIKRKGTPTPLVWKDTGAGVPAPHHGYEAWTATGEYYTISPGLIFPTHKFSGYGVNYYWPDANGDRMIEVDGKKTKLAVEYVASRIPTAEKAKAIAQKHWDARSRAGR